MANEKRPLVIEDDSFVLTMRFARLFGVAPVRFANIRGTTAMYISRPFSFYAALITIVFYTIGIHDVFTKFKYEKAIASSKKNLTLVAITYLSTAFLVTYAIFCSVKRSKRLMYCIDQINKIKKFINIVNEPKSKKWKYFSIVTFLLCALVTLIVCDIFLYNGWSNINNYFHGLLGAIMIIMEIQFTVVAMSVKSAFEVVNINLQRLLDKIDQESERENIRAENLLKPSTVKIPVKSINVTIDLMGIAENPDAKTVPRIKMAHEIRQITHAFVSTCNVLREFNSSESVILFMQLVIFSLDLVMTTENFLKTLEALESSDNPLRLIESCWFLYHSLRILMLVEPCCKTQVEIIETRFLVGRFICYVNSEVDPLRVEIEDFFKQLMLNDVSYSAMGICYIGRPLISTIIGSVTTILLLLYEF